MPPLDDDSAAEPTLEDLLLASWCALTAAVEWVCHAGIGRAFAPWDPATTREYAAHVDALRARTDALTRAGLVRPERGVAMHAALGAHAAEFPARGGLAEMRARDCALRDAFAPPEALRASVREQVPEGPWPLPRFVAPPPRP